jgi:phage/plasmid-associated DNA primase
MSDTEDTKFYDDDSSDQEYDNPYEEQAASLWNANLTVDKYRSDLAGHLSSRCRIGDEDKYETEITDLSGLVYNNGRYECKFGFKGDERSMMRFFKSYEECRRHSRCLLKIAEIQKPLSGLWIDLDCICDTPNSIFNSSVYTMICSDIFEVMNYFFSGVEKIFIGIMKKPRMKEIVKDGAGKYRDGLHIICPTIWMEKSVKEVILTYLRENYVASWLRLDETPEDIEEAKKYLDPNSKHVTSYLLGSAKKEIQDFRDVYKLAGIFEAKLRSRTKATVAVRQVSDQEMAPLNLSLELSLSFKHPNQGSGNTVLIEKNVYAPSSELTAMLEALPLSRSTGGWSDSDDGSVRLVGGNARDMALAEAVRFAEENQFKESRMQDPNFHEILGLLDLLNPTRYDDREKWLQVLCALASKGNRYKMLAIYFSKKSSKFTTDGFEKTWNSVVKNIHRESNPAKKKVNIASLYHFAMRDNPAGFRKLKSDTIFGQIQTQLYGSTLNLSLNGINDMATARLLYTVLGYKLVFDNCSHTWFQFISTPEEETKSGELYKWKCWTDGAKPLPAPTVIPNYMSTTFQAICSEVLEVAYKNKERYVERLFAAQEAKQADGEEKEDRGRLDAQIKQIGNVINRFQKYISDLGEMKKINSVVRACTNVFSQPHFELRLDSNPRLLGVRNGILELMGDGSPPILHVGFNDLNVSKYTDVEYVPFNPHDEVVEYVWKSLRALFPDEESDSFEYVMMSLARSLDHLPRESIILSLVGCGSNGKSTLLELHSNMMGPDMGDKIKADIFLDKKRSSSAASPEFYKLKHLRFAYCSETNAGEELNESVIKELTGNEKLSVRQLYKGSESIKPNVSLFLSTNNPIRITSTDHGIRRRWRTMTMKMTFRSGNEIIDSSNPYDRKEDPKMSRTWSSQPEVLTAYLSIMTWFYCKLNSVYAGQLNNVPQYHLTKETHEYFITQDYLYNFLASQIIKEETGVITESELKERFKTWYEGHYSTVPHKAIMTSFMTKLADNSDFKKYTKTLKNNTKVFVGIKLLPLTGNIDNYEFPFSIDGYFERSRGDCTKPQPQTIEESWEAVCREYDSLNAHTQT